MRVFTYVIATDSGSAPNFESPCTTLAICKPKVRLGAQPGDLVLAFTGTNLGRNPHGVRWAGVVTEKLRFSDYWYDKRFAAKKPGRAQRPDNIYEPLGLDYRQIPNVSHGPESRERDLGGKWVLVFERAWHFGGRSPELPAHFGLRMIGGRRGHRVAELADDGWRKLERWLNAQNPTLPSNQLPDSPKPVPGNRTQRC